MLLGHNIENNLQLSDLFRPEFIDGSIWQFSHDELQWMQ